MFRKMVLTLLVMFSANPAYALKAKDVVTKGQVIASGANDNLAITMLVGYNGELYNCRASQYYLECQKITRDMIKGK